MTSVEFSEFVESVREVLSDLSRRSPELVASRDTGEKFEALVADAAQAVIDRDCPEAQLHYTPGSHAFPDIVVEFPSGERYGIEVKSSSSSASKAWKINGNSVLGSTKENVLDTYIIFGKTAKGHQAFRYKRYEDAVANVGVTHSPRYLIDLDIAPDETFFAKSGLSYQKISQSDNPIGLITDYFRDQGQRAWWLAESASSTLRLFGELSTEERDDLIGYCFAHFPEVFSAGSKKFSRCAIWMVMDRSVVPTSLRDHFSAGGRTDVKTSNGAYLHVSRVFQSLYERRAAAREALKQATNKELLTDWEIRADHMGQSLQSRAEVWSAAAAYRVVGANGEEEQNVQKMLLDILLDE